MKTLLPILTLLLTLLLALPAQAQRTADLRYWSVNTAQLTAGLLDMELTQSCISAGTCKEGNPFAPTTMRGQLTEVLVMSASDFASSYWLKKRHNRLWWMVPSFGIAAHSYGAWTGSRYFAGRWVIP